jgi:hypothetical protein
MFLVLPCNHRVVMEEAALDLRSRVASLIIVCDVCNDRWNLAVRKIGGISDARLQRAADRAGIPVFMTKRMIEPDGRVARRTEKDG